MTLNAPCDMTGAASTELAEYEVTEINCEDRVLLFIMGCLGDLFESFD